MLRRFGLMTAIIGLLALAGCADPPPPIATAPNYKPPQAAQGATATFRNSFYEGGVLFVDRWAFVSAINGAPIAQKKMSVVPIIVAAGSQLVEAMCILDEYDPGRACISRSRSRQITNTSSNARRWQLLATV